jgi:hypothetical protein
MEGDKEYLNVTNRLITIIYLVNLPRQLAMAFSFFYERYTAKKFLRIDKY